MITFQGNKIKGNQKAFWTSILASKIIFLFIFFIHIIFLLTPTSTAFSILTIFLYKTILSLYSHTWIVLLSVLAAISVVVSTSISYVNGHFYWQIPPRAKKRNDFKKLIKLVVASSLCAMDIIEKNMRNMLFNENLPHWIAKLFFVFCGNLLQADGIVCKN